MSTFNGIIAEFSNIRVDCFRHYPGVPTPAAYFLSHVHSDHLLGLDTLKSPFVYCSAATRRLLLKMEKYPHRINFAKGILEARKQSYKHLKTILRPLPLNCPVELELSPKSRIRVTLFDANHCPGAVMFLIEGDGKAILYTGDVRAEPWFVNAVARQPVLLPYTTDCKRLDCVYLDTTFASHHDIHRKFPTKAEGLAELLHKLSRAAPDAAFYFRAWTLGYEDVWVLLSSVLASQVHVDEYQLHLFRNIAEDGIGAEPGPVLSGCRVGNAEHPGCLTVNPNVRIHSCEPGTPCHARIKKDKNVVWITPIISRMGDVEIAEIGAGGRRGDLYQHQDEIELDDKVVIDALRLLFEKTCQDPVMLEAFNERLAALERHGQSLTFEGLNLDPVAEISVRDFVTAIASKRENGEKDSKAETSNIIHFPYSRHSSYEELRHLLSVLRPKDICPCTVDLDRWEDDELSMESLFGDLCSGTTFKYDKDVRQEIERRRPAEDIGTESTTQAEGGNNHSQASQQEEEPDLQQMLQEHVTEKGVSQHSRPPLNKVSQNTELTTERLSVKEALRDKWRAANTGLDVYYRAGTTVPATTQAQENLSKTDLDLRNQPVRVLRAEEIYAIENEDEDEDAMMNDRSFSEDDDIQLRAEAFEAALECMETGDDSPWRNIRLQSLDRGYHTHRETEV